MQVAAAVPTEGPFARRYRERGYWIGETFDDLLRARARGCLLATDAGDPGVDALEQLPEPGWSGSAGQSISETALARLHHIAEMTKEEARTELLARTAELERARVRRDSIIAADSIKRGLTPCMPSRARSLGRLASLSGGVKSTIASRPPGLSAPASRDIRCRMVIRPYPSGLM